MLSEIKTTAYFSLNGFKSVINPAKDGHRGGVALLVRNCLYDLLYKLDTKYENIIKFQLQTLPGFVFICCYITPDDSPYYDEAIIGKLQSMIIDYKGLKVVMMGDLNARIGELTNSLSTKETTYIDNEDKVVNRNGKKIIQLCKDNELTIVNNLCYKDKLFKSTLSYRKRNNWISQLDYCIVSKECLPYVETFEMIQTINTKQLPSDHAAIKIRMKVPPKKWFPLPLECRASNLGRCVYEESQSIILRKTSPLERCDAIKGKLMITDPPLIENDVCKGIENFVKSCERIMDESKRCVERPSAHISDKWKRIAKENDSRLLWKAIGWNGEIRNDEKIGPTDAEFKMHFEELLCKEDILVSYHESNNQITIPVLDDPISTKEVNEAIKSMKSNKAYVGITPGFLKLLPMRWMMFLAELFNLVLFRNYPKRWYWNKFIIIFKKGLKTYCGNYRGISIIDTLANVYDKILANRLNLWLNIDKCQAGAQEGRGCTEQILALRLLIDFAKCERKKLFVCFIDFSKAYDRISRMTLIKILHDAGCGYVMLNAIKAMYETTKNIFRSVTINSNIGIKQGGSSSGILFVVYMNCLAKLIARACPDDSYLGSLHSLMMMDDTAMLASNRGIMIQRYDELVKFCDEYGMIINEDKTKFMVINGTEADKIAFYKGGVTVKHTESYTYLGSPFAARGTMKDDLKLHVETMTKHVNKFKIFCHHNTTMPFHIKKKVYDAMLVNKLIYACETWLQSDLKEIEVLYMDAIRSLLGVRKQVQKEVILIEAGLPLIQDIVRHRQQKFIQKKLKDPEEPLTKVYNICKNSNTRGYKILCNELTPLKESLEVIKRKVQNNQNTKSLTYKGINPTLEIHHVYQTTTEYIPDYKREWFTRFRTSSHSLAIEKMRWSRVPRENRVCTCDGISIQDEMHVIFDCEKTTEIRNKYNVGMYDNLNDLFENYKPITQLVEIIWEVMNLFK